MDVRELLFPPGADRNDWVLDGAIAGGLALLTVAPYTLSTGTSSMRMTSTVALGLMMVLPLALRRHSPLITMVLSMLAGLFQVLFFPVPMASLAAIPLVAYSVARWVPGRASRSVLVLGGIGAILDPWRWVIAGAGAGISFRMAVTFLVAAMICFGLVITPYAVGRRVRESSEAAKTRIEAAEERYHRLAAEAEQNARLSEARARTEIARELHDIVAHSVSVMVVQAEGGRALASKRPEAAIEALDTIADQGREALGEMRRIVGVLRGNVDTGADYAPAPSLDDIPELVRRSSDRVSLEVVAEPPHVSQALGVTVYRIVQEAITNFLRHAGPTAQASVRLDYSTNAITVDIRDDGPGSPDTTASGGNGLRGMAERVRSMGGTLDITSVPGDGFRIHAWLPLASRA